MYGIFRGRLQAVRFLMLAAILALLATGAMAVYAVGHPAEKTPAAGRAAELENLWRKQLVYTAVGAVGFFAVNLCSYRRLGPASYWMYLGVLLMLGVLLLDKLWDLPFVPVINGTRRWIRFRFGPAMLNLQPSEICKPVYVLALAWYLRYRSNFRRFRRLIGPFILTLLPVALIISEPDLGTALLMMPVLFAMLFAAGARARHLLAVILLAVVVSPLLWRQMDEYQKARVSSVLLQSERIRAQAEKHPALARALVGREFTMARWKSRWGYHLNRSKFAVASGRLTGYGFRTGPFLKYNFLPERHNDFIFAIIAHQWGFLGAAGLLFLYAVLTACGAEIAINNTDPFGRLVVTGITTMFAVEVLVNVGMTIGLMPITGLTLPFVSYGGSSLTVNMICAGLLNNIGRCRPFIVTAR